MQAYLLVFLGGGLGSICRYGIAHLLSGYKLAFPFATLIANVLSCILLGFLVSLSLNALDSKYKFLLMSGFCGGFSTFSTFTNETYSLMQSGQLLYAIANVFFSLLICLISIYLGIKLGQRVV